MAEREPRETKLMTAEAVDAIPWSVALPMLAGEQYYWMATVHPSGRPHVRPVLAVWVDGSVFSTTSPKAQKGRNIEHDPHCSVTARTEGLDLVLEGEAERVLDTARLALVAAAYNDKYGWPATVEGDAFTAPYGAPTAGLPPYELFEIAPERVYGFGTSDEYGPRTTRWTF
jgi:hypothetical protein